MMKYKDDIEFYETILILLKKRRANNCELIGHYIRKSLLMLDCPEVEYILALDLYMRQYK